MIGNNTPCKIVDVGPIKIRMHDGIVKTLESVRHILDLGQYLIPISTFDNEGYNYLGGRKMLKITKGSLVIIKGHLRHAKLYILEGSTIIGDSVITFSELDNNTL